MSRRRRATAALPDTGCHNCRHWREDLDAAAADERRGECHFHPPTVLWDPAADYLSFVRRRK